MTPSAVKVQASAQGVKEVAAAFDSFSAAYRLPESLVHDFQVALDELLSNTVRAGFETGRNGTLDVRFGIVAGSVDVLIVDDGIAFNPWSRPDPEVSAPLEERPVGGLGIYVARKLMDAVDYERVGQSNHTRLVKKLTGSG